MKNHDDYIILSYYHVDEQFDGAIVASTFASRLAWNFKPLTME